MTDARPCESLKKRDGGGGGIRTHGRVAPTTIFKTVAFNRSATPPHLKYRNQWTVHTQKSENIIAEIPANSGVAYLRSDGEAVLADLKERFPTHFVCGNDRKMLSYRKFVIPACPESFLARYTADNYNALKNRFYYRI